MSKYRGIEEPEWLGESRSAKVASLEDEYAAALTRAESLPAGSEEQQDAFHVADRILQSILDLNEHVHPTPWA